ncbi:MAG: hypothetical protein KKA51_05470 [Nanoarchaeota archaeon]|nr:hypothetical protein [Nanoarchaeota archaeon]
MKKYLIGIYTGIAISLVGLGGVSCSAGKSAEIYKNKPQLVKMIENTEYKIKKEINNNFNKNYVNNLVEELYEIRNSEEYLSANKEFEKQEKSRNLYDLLTMLFGAMALGGVGLAGIIASRREEFDSDLENLIRKIHGGKKRL